MSEMLLRWKKNNNKKIQNIILHWTTCKEPSRGSVPSSLSALGFCHYLHIGQEVTGSATYSNLTFFLNQKSSWLESDRKEEEKEEKLLLPPKFHFPDDFPYSSWKATATKTVFSPSLMLKMMKWIATLTTSPSYFFLLLFLAISCITFLGGYTAPSFTCFTYSFC